MEKELTGKETEPSETDLLQDVQEPDSGDRAGDRDRGLDAGLGQIPRLLSGDDLRGLPGGSKHREWGSSDPVAVHLAILQVPACRPATDFSARSEREGIVNPILPKQPRVRLDHELYDRLRAQVLHRDSWRCQFCGAKSNLDIHHQEFRSHGGDDTEDNLITLCIKCHSRVHRYDGLVE